MSLQISQKFSLLSSILVALTTGVVAAVLFYYLSELSTERRYGYLTDVAVNIGENLKKTVDGVARDALLIADLPSMHEFAMATDPDDRAAIKERLAGTLERWIRITPHYLQVRFIDAKGMEVLRFDQRGGKVSRTAERDLQDKSQRGFFAEAVRLDSGQFFVSQVDLNQEHGTVEVPHVPTLRTSTPVDGADGSPFGVVVINLAMDQIFAEMERATVGLGQLLVVNAEGDYLFHADRSKTFGFDLGRRYRIFEDFPSMREVFAEASNEPRNMHDDVKKHVWLTRLQPVEFGGATSSRRLWVGVQADQEVLTSVFAPMRNRLLLVAFAVILVAMGTSIVFARRLARPIRDLSAAIGAFDPNDEKAPTPLARSGTAEIDDLSKVFSRMRDTVRTTTKKLSLTNVELEHFTYAAAHDLQEPLRKIATFSELLREDLAPVVQQGDTLFYLDALQRSAQRMRHLIDDILQLPIVGQCHKLEETDSQEALKIALDSLDPLIRESGGKIVASSLPSVLGDRNGLSRVFQNLIGNALKFRQDERPPVVEIHAAANREFWQFSVKDNGIGMDSRYTHKIFLPFQRLHGKDRYPGSGMGLAICRRIIEGFGGKLWVDSTPGVGSVFHFTVLRPESASDLGGTRT